MLVKDGSVYVLTIGGTAVGALSLDTSSAFARVSVTPTVDGYIRIDVLEKPDDAIRVLLHLPGPRVVEVGVEGLVTELSALTAETSPAGLSFAARPDNGPVRRLEYVDLTGFVPAPRPQFAWGTPATPAISFPAGAQTGANMALTPAESFNALSMEYTVQRLVTGAWTDYAAMSGTTYAIPTELAGFSIRVRQRATGYDGADVETFDVFSTASAAISVPTAKPPMSQAYLTMTSEYRSGGEYGSNVYFSPILQFSIPGVTIGVGGAEAQWTTSTFANPADAPTNNIETIEAHPSLSNRFRPTMSTGASNGDITPTRLDFAVFTAEEVTRRQRWRWRYRTSGGGEWSDWSGNYDVPLPVVAPAAVGTVPTQNVALNTAVSINFQDYFSGTPLALSVSPAGPTVTDLSVSFPGRGTAGTDVWTVTATNSAGTATQTVTRTATVTPSAGSGVWRQLIARPAKFDGAAKADFPNNYPGGVYWGEGLQFLHACVREGDVIFGLQDMGGARMSRDGGITWFSPAARGLRGACGMGCGIDPANTDIMFAAVSMWHASNSTYAGGLFRTTNRGEDWTQVAAIQRSAIRQGCPSDVIACYPVTGGTSGARVWKYLEWSDVTRAWVSDNGPLMWRSNAGGTSWSSVKANGLVQGPDYYQLVQHPSNTDEMYLCSSVGLWRTTDNGANWSKIDAALGATSNIRRMWIDPTDGDRQLVARYATSSAGGIYYRATGHGNNFTQTLQEPHCNTVAVGPVDGSGRRTIYTIRMRSGTPTQRNPIVHNWTVSGAPASGTSSTSAAVNSGWRISTVDTSGSATGLGASANVTWKGGHFDSLAGAEHTRFMPSQTDPNRCWTEGYAPGWRTENRGLEWDISSTGFGGFSVQDIAFDQTDRNRMAMPATDFPYGVTYDGWKTVPWITNFGNPTQGQLETLVSRSALSNRAAMMFPASASNPRRVVMGPGNTNGTQLLARSDPPANLANEPALTPLHGNYTGWTDAQGGGLYNLTFAGTSWQTPNLGYIGPLRTTDSGASFTRLSRNIVGISRQNGDKVYGVASGSVAISTDRGTTWAGTAYTTGLQSNDANKFIFALSPHDDDIALTVNSGAVGGVPVSQQDVVLLKGPAPATAITLGLRAFIAPANNVIMRFDSVEWCSQDPLTIYAGYMNTYGLGRIYRGKLNVAMTSCTWTDITGNYPKGAARACIKVHPATGDVFLCGGHGVFIHEPSTGLTSLSLYNNGAIPFRNP